MNGDSNEELGSLVQTCFENIEQTVVKEFEDYIREEESYKGKKQEEGNAATKASTAQQLNTSTPQHLNTSTTQQINTSTPQQINGSTPQQLNPSPPLQLNLPNPQRLNPSTPVAIVPSEKKVVLEKKKTQKSLRNLASKPEEDPRGSDKENDRRQNVDASTQTPMKDSRPPRPIELMEEELYSAEERREEALRALRACEAEVGRLRRQLSQARLRETGRGVEVLRCRGVEASRGGEGEGSAGLTLERIRAMMIESRERSLRRAAKTRLETETREREALRSKAAKEAEQKRNIEERRYRIQGRLETLKAQADARRRANEVADTVIRTVLHTKEAGFV